MESILQPAPLLGWYASYQGVQFLSAYSQLDRGIRAAFPCISLNFLLQVTKDFQSDVGF
jgi:hypothetical protein